MIMAVKSCIFLATVAINYILLLGLLWTIAFPNKRIWPPPKKWSWQYTTTWALFYVAFALNATLVVIDWNTWVIPNEIRFVIGIPVAFIGALWVTWGITTLGVANTSGQKAGLIASGPYRYTRNPQYLGDMILFLGIGLISNSLYSLIVHLLMALVFMFTPFSEEPWLEQQYGEDYCEYKKKTSRFV